MGTPEGEAALRKLQEDKREKAVAEYGEREQTSKAQAAEYFEKEESNKLPEKKLDGKK